MQFKNSKFSVLSVCQIDLIYWVTTRLAKLVISNWKSPKFDGFKLWVILPLSLTDKLLKIFKITFSGGEPFLVPNFVEACEALTQKHFIGIHSNLTSNSVEKFAQCVNPKQVTGINASLHLRELERCGLVKHYIRHFKILKDKGFDPDSGWFYQDSGRWQSGCHCLATGNPWSRKTI